VLTLDFGIDLGTANTLVYHPKYGIVVREPSAIARSRTTGKILAVGREAYDWAGKTHEDIVVVRPLKDGNIADYDAALEMLKYYIKRAKQAVRAAPFLPWRIRLVVGVPSGATQVEEKALSEAAMAAGAKEVYLIKEPLAAAIGAGLEVEKAVGHMVMDIGGGTTEVAVISLGGLVTWKSCTAAGDAMNRAIVNYLDREQKLLIGEKTAEELKIKIGKAHPDEEELETVVVGRDKTSGLTRSVSVTSTMIMNAIKPILDEMVDVSKAVLGNASPDLHRDIHENGLVLTGGGALLRGLRELLRERLGIPVSVAENPLDCVALGTGRLLESIELMRKVKYERMG